MRKGLNSWRILSVLFFMVLPFGVKSQFNLAIAYKTGITAFDVNNDLLTAYQPVSGDLQKPFASLQFVHGIELGLRYRISNWGIEVGWENMSRDRSAVVFNPQNESFTSREYNYSIGAFKLGLDNYFGPFAIGASIQSRNVRIDRIIDNNDLAIVNQRKTAIQFHVIWMVQQSDFVGFGIKPYYQTGVNHFDLTSLAEDLQVSLPGYQDYADRMSIWGISFIFYNGRQ